MNINMEINKEIKFATWPFPRSFQANLTIKPIQPTGERLSVLNLKVVHINDVESGRYRFTIVYRPCLKSGSPKMYELAVAVCSPKDTYVRKIGTELALTRFEAGEIMILPLAHSRDAETNIRYMFSTL